MTADHGSIRNRIVSGRLIWHSRHNRRFPVRLVCELILIIGLIALGWQKSFKQWTDDWRGMRQTKTMPVHQTTAVNTTGVPRQPFVNAGYTRNAPPRAQPTVSNGDWMWDPSHRTVLDRSASDVQAS